MKIKITLNQQAIKNLENAAKEAAQEAMEYVYNHLANVEQTMPFDTGNLQNGGTYVYTRKDGSTRTGATVSGNAIVDFSEENIIHIGLTNDAPQARRLYYHPEYNFQTGKNPNAGAYWLEPYLTGSEKDTIKTFKKENNNQ